jgi:hypothetical protein
MGGALVSLVSLLAIALLARRARAGVGTWIAAAVAPPLAFAAIVALVPEQRAEDPSALTPAGQEIVVEDLAYGTMRFDTVLGGGISLVGAALDNPMPEAGGTVHLELDWRRDAVIDEGLGIFVHVEPNKGDTLNGDHFDLSQALSFEKAPPGKVLRDIVPITLPADSSKKTWKIWVGLWRLQRGGARVPVLKPGSAIVEHDRILAGQMEVR